MARVKGAMNTRKRRNKILKLARTIADLSGENNISTVHLSEAIMLRSLDKSTKIWFLSKNEL